MWVLSKQILLSCNIFCASLLVTPCLVVAVQPYMEWISIKKKNYPVFLPADGEASWLQLRGSISLLSGSEVQQGNNYSCVVKVTGQVWESQKKNKHKH